MKLRLRTVTVSLVTAALLAAVPAHAVIEPLVEDLVHDLFEDNVTEVEESEEPVDAFAPGEEEGDLTAEGEDSTTPDLDIEDDVYEPSDVVRDSAAEGSEGDVVEEADPEEADAEGLDAEESDPEEGDSEEGDSEEELDAEVLLPHDIDLAELACAGVLGEPTSRFPVAERDDLQTAIDEAVATGEPVLAYLTEAVTDAGAPLVIPAGARLIVTSVSGQVNSFQTTAAGRHFSVSGSLCLEDVVLSGDPDVTVNHGGVEVLAGASLHLAAGSVIEHARAAEGGGINVVNNGSLTVDGGAIRNNVATGAGGGIAVRGTTASNATVILRNSAQVVGNRTAGTGNFDGGGIFQVQGQLFVESGTVISGNIANRHGGGINAIPAMVTISPDVTITGNTATAGSGGGVNLRGGSTLYATEATFSGNHAQSGGGIGTDGADNLTVIDSTIDHNTASTAGGGINLISSSSLTITASTVTNNGANTGAGLSLAATASATVTEVTFADNTATVDGGAISHSGSNALSLNSSTVERNHARDGGGLNASGSGQVTVSGTTVADNTATRDGAGIRSQGSGLVTITGSTITANVADRNGGGLAADSPRVRIFGSSFSGNHADGDGGGASITGPNVVEVTIDSTQFQNNRAGVLESQDGAGGGINLAPGRPAAAPTAVELTNLTLLGNTSGSRGGGIRIANNFGDVQLKESILITGNSTGGGGGGLFVGSSFSGTLTLGNGTDLRGGDETAGLLIYDNQANHGGGIWLRGGALTINDGTVIRGNTATANGGGISIFEEHEPNARPFVMIGGVIEDNVAGTNGGGIHARRLRGGHDATIAGGTIENNKAANGGGIAIQQMTVNLGGEALVASNRASADGGGIWAASEAHFGVTDAVTFSGNTAGNDGGAIFVSPTVLSNPDGEVDNPTGVYPQIAQIAGTVTFAANIAEGGRFDPPANYPQIVRFDGRLLTNDEINFRTTLRVQFNLLPGATGVCPAAFADCKDFTIAALAAAPDRVIGADRIPTELRRPGWAFVGWRVRDLEPPAWGDAEFGDRYAPPPDPNFIFSSEDVANWRVDRSVEFEAIWITPAAEFNLHKMGESGLNVAPGNPLWDDETWLTEQLREGAVFHLYRFWPDEAAPEPGLVTPEMIGAGLWRKVDTGTSTGDLADPIRFMLAPDKTYQLVEVTAPGAYQVPAGQWRVEVYERDPGGVENLGVRVTSIGGADTPNLINRGGTFDLDGSAYFGGDFFVGNHRWVLELPMTGGPGTGLVTLLGGSLLLLAVTVFLFDGRRSRAGTSRTRPADR